MKSEGWFKGPVKVFLIQNGQIKHIGDAISLSVEQYKTEQIVDDIYTDVPPETGQPVTKIKFTDNKESTFVDAKLSMSYSSSGIDYIEIEQKTELPQSSFRTEDVVNTFPNIFKKVNCPACEISTALKYVIIHLNDNQKWTREAIADWLDTLDVDLLFKENNGNSK